MTRADDRWDESVRLIGEELFRQTGQDVGAVLRVERPKLKALYDPGSASPTWYRVTLTDADLERDLAGMAKEFVANYRQQREAFLHGKL